MREEDVARLQEVVNDGPHDRDFLKAANAEWSLLMHDLTARIKLLPAYRNAVQRLTKKRMENRRYDFYLHTCNHLDDRLKRPTFADEADDFDSAIRQSARVAFDKVHADVYDEIQMFLVDKSSPIVGS